MRLMTCLKLFGALIILKSGYTLWMMTFSMSNFVILFVFSDLELKPVGTLEVKLVQAKELTNKDIIGKSDPFAVLYIRPLPNRMKTSKTIVIHSSPFHFRIS